MISAAETRARCGARSSSRARPGCRSAPTRASAACCSRRTAPRSPRATTGAPAPRTPRWWRWPTPATDARGATAVVTLEPCNHTGRTGPCAQALLDAGVGAGRVSPSPTRTRSRPAAPRRCAPPASTSRAACCSTRRATLNRAWTFAMDHGRPFVTWKFATTLDGRSAAADGTSRWISSRAARVDTHRLRARVRRDHGRHRHRRSSTTRELTVRDEDDEPLPHQPLRVVMGQRDLPDGQAGPQRPGRDAPARAPATRDEALAELHARDRQHVFLEGGPHARGGVPAGGLVDEVVAYVAPMLLGAGPSRRRRPRHRARSPTRSTCGSPTSPRSAPAPTPTSGSR